jgi:hypothetical protein
LVPAGNSKLASRIGTFRSSPRYGVAPALDGREVCNCSASKRHQFLKRLDMAKRTMVPTCAAGQTSQAAAAVGRNAGEFASPAFLCFALERTKLRLRLRSRLDAQVRVQVQGLASSDVHFLIKLRASRCAHLYVVAARPEMHGSHKLAA